MNEIRSNHLGTNMGAVKREEVEEFANKVLVEEVDEGWVMKWTANTPSICLKNKNKPGGTIHIRDKIIGRYPWEAYHEVLHEIAHISAGPGHGMEFHDEYARLILDHLGSDGK